MRLIIFSILICSTVLGACDTHHDDFRFASGAPKTSFGSTGVAIGTAIKEVGGKRLVIQSGTEFTGKHNVEMLLRRETDFAIAQNDLRSDQKGDFRNLFAHVRSVLPLYSEVLF